MIYRHIMQRGWSAARQAFVQHQDADVLDAAVLMMPLANSRRPEVAFHPGCAHRGVGVRFASLRYDWHASPDGLRGEEGTFSIWSFWYVEALTRAGRLDEISRTGEQQGNSRRPSPTSR